MPLSRRRYIILAICLLFAAIAALFVRDRFIRSSEADSGTDLAAAIDALQKAGYSLDPLEACPPDVPDADNFGATEPLLGTAARSESQTPEIKARLEAIRALKLTDPPKNGKRAGDLPAMPEMTADQPTDWPVWRRYLRDSMKWDVPGDEADDTKAVYAALRKRTGAVLPALIEASKSRSRFAPVPSQRSQITADQASGKRFVGSSGYTVSFPLLRSTLLQYEAALALGETDAAAELMPVIFALCRLHSHERSFVDCLAEHSAMDMIIETAWRGLLSKKLTAPQLAEYQRFFETRDLPASLGACFLFEATTDDSILSMLQRERPAKVVDQARAVLIFNFLRLDKALKTGGIAEYVRALDEISSGIAKAVEKKPVVPHMSIVAQFLDPTGTLTRSLARRDQRRKAFVIVCATERHRLATGRLPESLEEIPKSLLAEIPVDFDGQPLRYRLEGPNTRVIWSTGLDQRDDWHGAEQKAGAAPKEKAADWQWRLRQS